MDLSSKLGIELWENVFLHFNSKFDRKEIYNCLMVSKLFYSAMRGAPLFDSIRIQQPQQISQVVSSLTKDVTRARYVRVLSFGLRRSLWTTSLPTTARIELAQDLAAITFLLNLCSQLRQLHNVPILASRYDSTIRAMRALAYLRSLALAHYASSEIACKTISWGDAYSLIGNLKHHGILYLSKFERTPLPAIFAPSSLPTPQVLALHHLEIDAICLRALLRCFASPIASITISKLDEDHISWDDTISIVVEEAPRVVKLCLLRIASGIGPPLQHDFLSNLKDVQELEFSGFALAWDSLHYLGSAVEDVVLRGTVLTASELASSLAFCNFDHGISIELRSCGYDERSRLTLTTIGSHNPHINLKFTD